MLEPVKKKRLYEDIMQQIQDMVEAGSLSPGDKLPSERELANKFGVARSSLREALKILSMLGFLESKQGEGTFIKKQTSAELVDTMAFFLLHSQKSLQQLFEVRGILEIETARLAAERASAQDISNLKKIIELAEEKIKNGEIPDEEDAIFHYRLAEASGNDILVKVMHTLREYIKRSSAGSLQKPGRPGASLRDHKAILKAIISKDGAKARSAMQAHLLNTKAINNE